MGSRLGYESGMGALPGTLALGPSRQDSSLMPTTQGQSQHTRSSVKEDNNKTKTSPRHTRNEQAVGTGRDR